MPQKNSVISDFAISDDFSSFHTDYYSIAKPGDIAEVHAEMAHYNVNHLIDNHERIYDQYGRRAIFDVCRVLGEGMDLDNVRNNLRPSLFAMIHDMNHKGATGFGEKTHNKGRFLTENFEKFYQCFRYPITCLSTHLPIWTVVQKGDEVRVASKHPRTYQFPPVQTHVAMSVSHYGFDTELKAKKFILPFALGYSPEYDIDQLMNRFLLDGHDPIAMFNWDGTKFDRSLPEFIIRSCYIVRKAIYKACGADSQLLALLDMVASSLACRVHILPDGKIILVRNGNPSGAPATSTNNSLAQILMWSIMLMIYKEERPECNLEFTEFLRDTGFLCMGDDGTLAIHNQEQMDFCKEVPRLWNLITGVNCTIEFVPNIEDSIFLGRKAFRRNGKWFSYCYDYDRISFGLIHKSGKLINFTSLRQQRLLGVWQNVKWLHLHPKPGSKKIRGIYKVLSAIEAILDSISKRGLMHRDVRMVYNRDKVLLSTFLQHESNQYSACAIKTDAEYFLHHGRK